MKALLASPFVRFVVVGGIGFVVDAGGTGLLVRAGVAPLVARIGPLCAAIVCTWALNRTLTFRVERPRSRKEFARYAAVASTSAALNYLLYGAFLFCGLDPVVAVAVATVLLLLFSFFSYRWIVFR